MDRQGIRTVGVVERVWVPQSKFDGGAVNQSCGIDIVVSFTDQKGVVHIEHKATAVLVDHLLTPGCEIEVCYMPDNPDKWDYFSTGSPDQSVPRGWGAGIFEVEDIGEHHTRSLFGVTAGSLVGIDEGNISEQRDMFRSGPIVSATIINVSLLNPRGFTTGAHEFTLTLRAEDKDYQTTAFIPGKAVPQSGDVVKIVVGVDGRIALDSDERYNGPPGQALVFTTPPEIAAQREPVFSIRDYINGTDSNVSAPSAASTGDASAPAGDAVVAQLTDLMASYKRSRRQMGKRYEKIVRGVLDPRHIAGLIDDATYEQLLQQALSE